MFLIRSVPIKLLVVSMTISFSMMQWTGAIEAAPQFSAMFVFGDSLVDNGNNNLLGSIAKSNYYPYGIDYRGGPTGRFSNGKTIIDFLGDLVGLPPLPAYATTLTSATDISKGVNYASAAAGILDESGRYLGDRYSMSRQVQNFRGTLAQLKRQMDETTMRDYLARSLVIMNLGSNDYINNYLLPTLYTTSYNNTPQQYADLLIDNYAREIMNLHGLGMRKFMLAGVGPLGCMPNQIAYSLNPPGNCVTYVNNVVQIFNMKLKSLVDQLNTNHNDSAFLYGNIYGAFVDIREHAASYGFKVIDAGCCGIGRNRGQLTCLPMILPCANRDQYIFWDAYHPTHAFNRIIAQRAYAGPPSDCYPFNVKQLALR